MQPSTSNGLLRNNVSFCLNKWKSKAKELRNNINTAANTKIIPKKNFTHNIKNNVGFFHIAVLANDNVSDEDGENFNYEDLENEIAELTVYARVEIQKGNLDNAENLLSMGINLCKKYQYEDGYPKIYEVLVTIALTKGDIEKAESLLLFIIKKMTYNGTLESDDKVIEFKLKLARIYSSYGENDFAELLFRTCLEVQRRKLRKELVSPSTGKIYVKILLCYGVHMIRNFRFATAKSFIDKAYDYSKNVKNVTTPYHLVV